MKIIVIPDNCYITRIKEVDEHKCKDCIFSVTEPEDDTEEYENYCGLSKLCRVPCTDTIYAIVEYEGKD